MMADSHPISPGYSRAVAWNVGVLLAGGVVGKVCRFAAMVIVANALGPMSFGVLTAAMGAAVIVSVIADMGLSRLATRELARSPETRADLAVNFMALKSVLLLIACGGFLVVAMLLPIDPATRDILFACVVLVPTFEVTFEWLFEGSDRMGLLAVYRVLLNVGFLVAVLVMVRRAGEAAIVPLLDGCSSLVAFSVCLVAWPTVRAYLRGRLRPAEWPGLLKSALPFGAGNLMILAAPHVGVFVLIAMAGAAAAGVFRAAGMLVFGLASVGALVSRAVYPVTSRVAHSDPEAVPSMLAPVYRLVFALSLPAAVGGMLISPQLIGLFYTDEYGAAAHVLAVMIWALPLTLIASVMQGTLLAYGRPGLRAIGLGLQLVLEASLAVWLVTKYSVAGAAIAHLVGQAFGFAFSFIALWRVARMPVIRYAVAPALASAIMATAVIALADASVAVVVPVGAVVYAASFVPLTVVAAMVRRQVG
jgi:O-antigen/teichoic acid export membrane protein